ncbi:MAG: cysteine hydrolase [Oscillospiraceae bacterium]|nr:cysteine hydrolase [Oscillospiraceae bacterium]
MKKLLIVVDYQKDFVDGTLGFPAAALLETAICGKIESCRNSGADICFTFDTHTSRYLETQEGKKLPFPHCLRGSGGWELYGKAAALRRAEDRVFEKPSFGSLELLAFLKEQDYEEIELVGLISNICVLSNAVLAKTALPEARIVVDASCTASFDADLNEKALDVMAGLQMELINRK